MDNVAKDLYFGTKTHENIKQQHGAKMFQSFHCNFTAPRSPFLPCTADFCRDDGHPWTSTWRSWDGIMPCLVNITLYIFVKIHPKLNEVKTCSNNLKLPTCRGTQWLMQYLRFSFALMIVCCYLSAFRKWCQAPCLWCLWVLPMYQWQRWSHCEGRFSVAP